MIQELYDPSLGHLGIFGCNGRLIKRSTMIKNRIFFEEKMRLIEDKIFGWNLLSFCDRIIYVRKATLYLLCKPKYKYRINR
jgi:hypothetical protein